MWPRHSIALWIRFFATSPLFTYLDDHFIASQILEEHLDHLRKLLDFPEENGLQINPAKDTFAAAEVDLLGY
jgi:hypothetical protein